MDTRDAQHWERWQRQADAAALRELVLRYGGLVYGACRRMLHDPFAAEDTARATFHDLARQHGPLADPLPVWLYHAALRHAAARHAGSPAPAPETAPGDLEAHHRRALERIDDAIAALPDSMQEIVIYRFLADYNLETIAEALDTNEASVRQRIGMAVDRLRARLENESIAISAAELTGLLSSRLVEEAPASLAEAVIADATAHPPAAPPLVTPGLDDMTLASVRRRRSSVAGVMLVLVVLLVVAAGALVFFQDKLRTPASTLPEQTVAESAPTHAESPPAATALPPETAAIVGAGLPAEAGETDLVIKEEPMPPPSAEGDASITGRVLNAASGVGIAGVTMGAFERGAGAYAGTRGESAAGGEYKIEKLPAGEYLILPTDLAGYSARDGQEGRSVKVAEGETVANVDFALEDAAPTEAGAAISGYVRDASGRAIADVLVNAAGAANASTFSAADGNYHLSRLAEGTYALSATKAGYRPAELGGVQAGTTNADLVLHQTAALEAEVRSAATKLPITEYEVDFLDAESPATAKMFDSPDRLSARDGAFIIDDLYPGRLQLGVRAEGYQPSVQDVTLEEGSRLTLEIALKPEGRFEGRVVNSAGDAVAGAYIFLGAVPQGADWEAKAAARTNEEGVFVLDAAPKPDAYLTAFHPDYAATTSTLDGGNTITLPDGGILEGLVKEGGNPVSGAEVTVSVDAAFAPRTPAPVHTVTAVDGVFKFLGLTPGKVSVQVQHPDFGTRTETVTIAARQTATLNVDFGSRAARVSGSVVENGSPVSRAPVQLGVTTEQGPRNYETYTDSRGLFGFDNVSPGQARLRVDHRNMQRVTEFAIAAGDSVQRDIDFSGGTATVAGKVEGYDPGIYGASILALQGDVTLPQVAGPTFFKDLQPHLVAQTDAAPGGEYELSGLPAGQYTIAAVIVPRTGKGDRSQIRSSATKTTLAEGGSATLNFDFH